MDLFSWGCAQLRRCNSSRKVALISLKLILEGTVPVGTKTSVLHPYTFLSIAAAALILCNLMPCVVKICVIAGFHSPFVACYSK